MRFSVGLLLIVLASFCCGQITVQPCPAQCRCLLMHRSVTCRSTVNPTLTTIPSGYPEGTIRVNLDNNRISHLDTRPFTSIRPTLFELTLNNNDISKLNNSALEGFGSIKRFELSKNKISCLRKQYFYGLSELEHFQMNQNRLVNISDFTFIDLSHLQQLWLSQNRLTAITEKMFIGLRNLYALDISNNRIRHIDSKSFTPMTNLRNLYLNNNHLSMLSSDWFKIPAQTITYPMLGNIKLSGNPWRCNCSLYTEYNETLRILTGLEIDCPDDNMCILCYTPFALQLLELHAIESTHWASCRHRVKTQKQPTKQNSMQCQSATKCVFVGNVKSQQEVKQKVPNTVEILTLINNDFPIINNTDFTGLYKLSQLHLRNNSISMIEDYTFLDQRKLKELDLQNNKLHSRAFTNKTFKGLSKLQTLNLQNNLINGNFKDGTFKPLSNLEVLFLANNQIKMIDSSTFHGLVGLGELHLPHNRIRAIHHKTFKNFDNLKVVDLEYNFIEILNFTEVFQPGIAGIYTKGNRWKCTCQLKQSLNQYIIMSTNSMAEYSCALDNLCLKCSSPIELANKNLNSLSEDSIPSCNKMVAKKGRNIDGSALGQHLLYSLVPSVVLVVVIIAIAYAVSLQKRFRGKVKVNKKTNEDADPESYNRTTTIERQKKKIIEKKANKNNNVTEESKTPSKSTENV